MAVFRTLLLAMVATSMLGILVAQPVVAEKRLALVVGIGAYASAPKLPNPVNDANAIADALEKLKFEVERHTDLAYRDLALTLRNFGIRAANADVVLIYFAGHGVQVSGQNYLVPTDARLERPRDLVYETLPLNLFLAELAQSRKLGIMILDACRNNPFIERLKSQAGADPGGFRHGLARVDDTPSDTLVAMATRANAVAEDGDDANSPYAAALLEQLREPGLELSLFFRRVRDAVLKETNGRQEPYVFGSLGATPFYLNPRPPNRPPVVAEAKPIELLDNAPRVALSIARPSDPDQDRMFATVKELPRGGAVKIGDRTVLIGDYLTVEQLVALTFEPDGSFAGNAGRLGFSVMDSNGGVADGEVRLRIKASNQPPQVARLGPLQAVANPLRIPAPQDPDGDPLTVIVEEVPSIGKIRSGETVVKSGVRLTPVQLTSLTYDPEDGESGPAGRFAFTVEDARGARTASAVAIEIVAAGEQGVVSLDSTVWDDIKTLNDREKLEAFVTLFPSSTRQPQARQMIARLDDREVPAAATTAAAAAAREDEPAKEKPARPDEPKLLPVDGPFYVHTDANIRDKPSTAARRLGVAEAGSPVRVVGRVEDKNWYLIEGSDRRLGFVHGDLLRPGVPPEAPESSVAAATADDKKTDGDAETKQLAMVKPSSPSRAKGNGKQFQDCEICPIMVRVPQGNFAMGAPDGRSTERPVHTVTVGRDFAIGAFEVTVGEWKACQADGGCPRLEELDGLDDDLPAHNIHWSDAQSYAKWLSQKTGHRYRLPSEAEWEYAARAGSSTPYWWGDDGAAQKANCSDCGGDYDRHVPAKVGSFDANSFGVHDMHGGVAEWVEDCWSRNYEGAPGNTAARTDGQCTKRVLRGGSWKSKHDAVRSSSRWYYDYNVRYVSNGFRVARDLY